MVTGAVKAAKRSPFFSVFLVLVLAAAVFHVAATATIDPDEGASFSGIWLVLLGAPWTFLPTPPVIGLLLALGFERRACSLL